MTTKRALEARMSLGERIAEPIPHKGGNYGTLHYGPNCMKSAFDCVWNFVNDDGGPPGSYIGPRRNMVAPPGFVIVGVGVRYDPGLTVKSAGPALSWAEAHVNWGPPADRGPMAPEVKMAAHVYGFPYIICAPARQVAASVAPDELHRLRIDASPDLSHTLPGGHLARAAEATAGAGLALAGIKIGGELGGHEEASARGAERVTFVWRAFVAGHPEGTVEESYPERPSSNGRGGGQAAVAADVTADADPSEFVVGCVESRQRGEGAALYVAALEWGPAERDLKGMFAAVPHHPRVGLIRVGCADFSDLLGPPADYTLACCTGAEGPAALYCRPTWQPQSQACDEFMESYCATSCASGACADPVCGCLGSPLYDPASLPPGAAPLPQCFDARCADDPSAYRPAGMDDASCAGATLTCADVGALGGTENVAAAWQGSVPPGCGRGKQGLVLVVLVFILLVLVALAARASGARGGKTAASGAPASGEALPPLPSLSEL